MLANYHLFNIMNTVEEKKTLVAKYYEFLDAGGTHAEFAHNHHISIHQVKRWVQKINNKTLFISSTKGRPPAINGTCLNEIKKSLTVTSLKDYVIRDNEINQKLLEAAHKTGKDRSIAGPSIKCLHKRVIRLYKTQLKVKAAHAEITFQHRVHAINNIRYVTAFVAMNRYMIGKSNEYIILNMDVTVFVPPTTINELKSAGYIGDHLNKLKVLPSKTEDNNTLPYDIKTLLLVSVSGHCVPPVYIIANPDLNKDVIILFRCSDLGISSDPNAYGYLVYCKSRACNINFYK